MWRRLARASIWAEDAMPVEDWKLKPLKRIWLPLFDIIALGMGWWAVAHGSPILNRILGPELVDVFGWLFSAAAAVAGLGIAFPRFWLVEVIAKITILAFLGAYVFMILTLRLNPEPANGFVVFALLLGFPLLGYRLQLLGMERGARRLLNEEEAQ